MTNVGAPRLSIHPAKVSGFAVHDSMGDMLCAGSLSECTSFILKYFEDPDRPSPSGIGGLGGVSGVTIGNPIYTGAPFIQPNSAINHTLPFTEQFGVGVSGGLEKIHSEP